MCSPRILGIKNMTITATSTAASPVVQAQFVDIELLLDIIASMNDADTNCSIKNATRIQCAEAGYQALLSSLAPSGDQVGIMTFPGVTTVQASADYDCSRRLVDEHL